MRVKIFRSGNVDSDVAMDQVEKELNAWLEANADKTIVSLNPAHAALPENEGTYDEHTYSVLVTYK